MSRYQKSESLFERSKKLSPGGVHSPVRAFKGVGGTPPFMCSANGSKIKDVDGNEYLDFCMSWGPLILGHCQERAKRSVSEALERGWSYGTTEPYSLELAELICAKIPALEMIRFVNSGTEAVLSALRLARAATRRSKIVKFDGCYHGHVDSMLVRAGSGLAEMAEPDSAGVTIGTSQDTVVAPLDDQSAIEEIFSEMGSRIAAVIIEPLPANNGLLPQRQEYLKFLREITQKHGALLIFDEVISGFRVALGGMAELTGIQPDLVTYGKVIGGGFPVGAYGGRADLMEQIAPVGSVYQAGTLSANPIAMTAGLATIKELIDQNPFGRLDEMGKKIKAGVDQIAQSKDIPMTCQQFGSLFWIIMDRINQPVVRPDQIPAGHAEKFKHGYHQLLDRGIYLAPSAYEVGFLSTAHTEQDLDHFLEVLRDVVSA